jgi:hypothetical protein
VTFYDAFLADVSKDASATGRAVQGLLKQAVVIKAQNVLRYYAEDITDTANFRKQLGALVPPFPYTWLEIGHPEMYAVGEHVMPWPVRGFQEAGVLLQATDSHSEPERWHITYSMAFRYPSDVLEIPPGDYSQFPTLLGYFNLDSNGIILGDATKAYEPSFPMSPMFAELLKWSHAIVADVMLLALSFLNCKNVSLEAVTPGAPGQTPEQKRRNIWPKAEHEYHTIRINPLRTVQVRQTQASDSAERHNRLHIVRGHFHTYTEDKPLFGRPGLFGQFWIPAHAKGSDSGHIESDYEIDV